MAAYASTGTQQQHQSTNEHNTNSHQHGNVNKPTFPQLSRKFVARRISEGETGRLKEELKCQACGKGYKHVSSLAKHLWEHTPEWNVTSKLLISKHQQVQLLEAASILVSMNDEEEQDSDPEDQKDIPESISVSSMGDSRDASKEPKSEISTTEIPTNEHPSAEQPASEQQQHKHPKYEPSTCEMPTSGMSTSKQSTFEPPKYEQDVHKPKLGLSHPPMPAPPTIPCASHTDDSAIDSEELTPARDIPILSARPISKTPARHSHRRHSTNAGSFSGLGSLGSLGRPETLLRQSASPLPESVLAKDHAHHPPHRRRRQSTFASSIPRESSLEYDEDGLQDPHESLDHVTPHTPKQSPKHSPKKSNTTTDDMFGLEV